MQTSLSINPFEAAVTVKTAHVLPVCETCGQPLPSETKIIQVHAGTIADIYDVWPTRPSGKRVGPNLLVVELKRQA
jgi:hypothetical protein